MMRGLPDTRTKAPDTPRGLLDPYTDINTPPRKKLKPPKPLRREVITHDKGQNEEAGEDEEEEAAEDMTERSNSYVPEMRLRSSPRHSRVTRMTYGKPYSKTAYRGVFRPEETRHNGLNGAADAEDTEEAVLTEAGEEDETYVPENNPVIENDNNNALVPEPPAAASSTSNVPAASTTVEIANGSSPTTQVAARQAEQAALDSPGDNLPKKRRETRRANDNESRRRYGQKNIRRAGTREDDDLVAATASPVTARVANKRKPSSSLQDTPRKGNRTRRGTDPQDMRLEGSAREDDAQTRRFRTPLQNRTEPNETQNDATFANIEAGAATASSTTKAQTRRKHVQTRLRNEAANRGAARPAEEPASNSDSEGSDGARFKTTTKRLKTTKNGSPAPQGQPHMDLAASLHSRSTVREIKDFLSKVSDIYGEKRLLLYPTPISFSSKDQKGRLKHLKKFQQCDTFPLWMRKPLNGASGRVGFFLTWTGSWVCQTKVDFKKAKRHVWAAVFTKGKLVIFDSNGDTLPEKVTGNDLWLHRQRVLFTYLKNEGYRPDVWVGGEGNNDQGIILIYTILVVTHAPVPRASAEMLHNAYSRHL